MDQSEAMTAELETRDDILATAAEWCDEGCQVGLATVIATWGSSPRPVGSQLVVDGEGRFEGSVSGGCIEGAVIETAIKVMANGQSEILEFGVSDEQAWEVGLACGGTVRVYIEKIDSLMKRDLLGRLNADRAEKRPVALVTNTSTSKQWLIYENEATSDAPPSKEVTAIARTALANDQSTTHDSAGASYFIQVYNPPLRLFIVGAVHITQALARMGRLAGYAITVIDPRRAFSEAGRFPGYDISSDWPDNALAKAKPDRRTAVVTLSHDPKIDDPALETVLRSDVFYIGSLGSNRTHRSRLARLHEKGFTESETDRIHGPVGLDIGAKSPTEIAISIMAEITQARRMAS